MSTVGESAAVLSEPRAARSLTGADVGLLILRVVVGIVFLGHGLQKFGLFDSGSYPNSISAQEDFLKFFGYSSVTFLAWTITLSELVAGLSLVLGAATQLGAAIIVGIMVQFVLGPQWDAGLFGNASSNGFEFSLVSMAIAVALAFAGPGRVSVDAAVGWKWSGLRWGGLACLVGLAVGLFVLVVWGVGVGGTLPPPQF